MQHNVMHCNRKGTPQYINGSPAKSDTMQCNTMQHNAMQQKWNPPVYQWVTRTRARSSEGWPQKCSLSHHTMVLPPNAKIYDAKMQEKTLREFNKSMLCNYAVMQLPTLIGPSTFNDLGYHTILSLTRLQIRGSSISQLAFLSKVTSGSNISVFVCECPQILFLVHFLLVVLKWKPPVSNNHHNTQCGWQ